MRCEDCLPVVEDYFDGALEKDEANRVGAHIAVCAECATALDALEAEQSLYLRYDRGLEVTPALWEGVRAGIARLEADDERLSVQAPALTPLAGLRGRLAMFFAALTLRPVFASSLALVLFGVVLGALLLRSIDSPQSESAQQQQMIADGGSALSTTAVHPEPVIQESAEIETVAATAVETKQPAAVTNSPSEVAALSSNRDSRRVNTINASASTTEIEEELPDPDHLELADAELLSFARQQPSEFEDEAARASRLIGPGEREVARHVERAQALLRSFRNTRSAEGVSSANVAYERALAQRLLRENLALQLDAEEAGDKTTGRVLDAIQPFLRDIANMRDEPSRDEVRSIKERMRKTEIVAALQVY